jgi:di/tricarboxylate transporter
VVAAALAMSHALFVSGGAEFIATQLLYLFDGHAPAVILSAFFLLCAVITNILSNNATAVLFTPLAVNLADSLSVDPLAFILAVVFAANCSFATPIAYQTNLLVMTPGNYQFRDFLRAGTPLIILVWLTYSIVAPWYFGF